MLSASLSGLCMKVLRIAITIVHITAKKYCLAKVDVLITIGRIGKFHVFGLVLNIYRSIVWSIGIFAYLCTPLQNGEYN